MFKEEAGKRKAGEEVTLYHGTSSARIPSIIKHGLLPTPPVRQWGEGQRSSKDRLQERRTGPKDDAQKYRTANTPGTQDSYEGTYATPRFRIAHTYALDAASADKDKGKEAHSTIVAIKSHSRARAVPDEDIYHAKLGHAFKHSGADTSRDKEPNPTHRKNFKTLFLHKIYEPETFNGKHPEFKKAVSHHLDKIYDHMHHIKALSNHPAYKDMPDEEWDKAIEQHHKAIRPHLDKLTKSLGSDVRNNRSKVENIMKDKEEPLEKDTNFYPALRLTQPLGFGKKNTRISDIVSHHVKLKDEDGKYHHHMTVHYSDHPDGVDPKVKKDMEAEIPKGMANPDPKNHIFHWKYKDNKHEDFANDD